MCPENSLTQSLTGRKFFGYRCVYCQVGSPFLETLEAARVAYTDHLTRHGADGFTEEQRRKWCRCGGAPADRQWCPLHGRFEVEWQNFIDGSPIGVEYKTDEYASQSGNRRVIALQNAVWENISIRNDDDTLPELRYRLLTGWTAPRA
jgi:hypothetical protein